MADPVTLSGAARMMPSMQEVRPGQHLGRGPQAYNATKPFAEFLSEKIEGVNALQQEADQAVADVATGKSHNIHEMMIALDKADVSFRMLAKVRNKAVEAYQEIMRMSV